MIKKYITIFVAVGFLTGNTLMASAQTTSSASDLQALIQSLQAQVNALVAQLGNQSTTKADVKASIGGIKGTLRLISQLREGSSGEDVKLLQETLAADPSVFPEGKVTGFFGKLTAKAVKRFQKKHGLDQVGNVGSKTLKKLNEELDKNPIAEENEGHENANSAHCAIVPPGHLIAPGWLKHHDGERPIVPACQTLPPGIERELEEEHGHGTSTPDTTPPVISSLTATAITAMGAHINWSTNEAAMSTVWYGTSSPVAAVNSTANVGSSVFAFSHDVQITGLTASTTYFYVAGSADASGNVSTSSQSSFITLPPPDLTPPLITGVSATSTASSSVHIVWTTNEPATSKISYSTSTVNLLTAPFVSDASLVLSHDLTISGLNASTTYFYVITSADASANVATSTQGSFMTTGL